MWNIKIKNLKPYTLQLVMLVAASAISVIMLLAGLDYYSSTKQKHAEIDALQHRLHREIDQLTAGRELLKNTGESFALIQNLGFFGAEDRLSWGEVLKTTAKRLKLPELRYSVSPQQRVGNLGIRLSPSLKLSQSIMDIEAGLLHEGDLITLSEQLLQAPGLFRVLGCDLQKEKEISLRQLTKNISLRCSLAWNTVAYFPEQDDATGDEIAREDYQ
mgnify:CR=1 FL=1